VNGVFTLQFTNSTYSITPMACTLSLTNSTGTTNYSITLFPRRGRIGETDVNLTAWLVSEGRMCAAFSNPAITKWIRLRLRWCDIPRTLPVPTSIIGGQSDGAGGITNGLFDAISMVSRQSAGISSGAFYQWIRTATH